MGEVFHHLGRHQQAQKENDMGIYLPNMSKPKGCKECQWHLDFYIKDEKVGGLCTITEKDDKENTCPLIEIVRCGECKWWNEETHGCNRNPSVNAWWETDFCSYGERK